MQKLQHPIENFSWKTNISQLFGVNKALYQPTHGIPGHNGIDYYIPGYYRNAYGTKILAAHDGIVSKISLDVPWKTKGNGIYLASFDNDNTFETIYWHLSEIQCTIGQRIKAGEVIGLMGNTGFVRPEPTQENPWLGTHLHFSIYLHGQENNEYGGFVDPVPWLYKLGDKLPIQFGRSLFLGNNGDDVSWLQTLLKLEFPEIDWQPIGQFGPKTFAAVWKLQQKYGLTSCGIAGPQTRAKLILRFVI